MATYQTSVTINHNRFPEIRAKLPHETKLVVAKTAMMILAEADPPRDTGNLAGFTSITENSVTWHAFYAGFVNYGTRYMAARPFVEDAVAIVRPQFIAAMDELSKAL
jgi:HK97 gp10 family phage protein